MRVNLLIPCIGDHYASILDEALSRWMPAANSVTVVTSTRDDHTNLVASKHGCLVHNTDIWWANGAHFNKAGAMEEARKLTMPQSDWHLFADADVIPDTGWLTTVAASNPKQGTLYGAHREMDDGTIKSEPNEIPGYFMLFHSDDPIARPSLGSWRHAGSYDSLFQGRWPVDHRVKLPLVLRHRGEAGVNWCGVGNEAGMASMRQERKRRGGWQHERLP